MHVYKLGSSVQRMGIRGPLPAKHATCLCACAEQAFAKHQAEGHSYCVYVHPLAVGLTSSCSRAVAEASTKAVEASVEASTPKVAQLAPKASRSG